MGLRDTGGQRNVGWEGQSRLAAPGGPTPRGPGAGRAAEAPERTNLRAVSRARSRGHGMHPLCSVVVLPTPPVARPAFRLTTAQSLSCQFWRRRDGAELTDRRRDGMRGRGAATARAVANRGVTRGPRNQVASVDGAPDFY